MVFNAGKTLLAGRNRNVDDRTDRGSVKTSTAIAGWITSNCGEGFEERWGMGTVGNRALKNYRSGDHPCVVMRALKLHILRRHKATTERDGLFF